GVGPVTFTVLNEPATGAASVPETMSVPGWFVAVFVYSAATSGPADPVSTKMRSCETVPLEPLSVLNASARPAAFESSFVSTDWFPKMNVAAAGGAAPVPVSARLCGLPAALSAIRNVALRVPATVGVNVTLTVHVPAGATDAA